MPRARSRPHELPAPDAQRPHHETKRTPAVGERVRRARRALRVERARQQSLTLHSSQAVGKQLRRDAEQLGAEVLKSRRTPKQVAHDEECPALAHQVERFRDGAVLAVSLRHESEYSRIGLSYLVSSEKIP